MLTLNHLHVIEPHGDLVRIEPNERNIRITLLPSAEPIKQVRIKWSFDTSFMQKVMPDTWGVALADMKWHTLPLPHPAQWYFAAYDGKYTHGFGVKT